MPTIRFVDENGALLGEQQAAPGDNLLDLARLADVPLHWRCGQGTCGTCKVRLATPESEQRPSRKERNVLLRAGAIDATQATSESWTEARPWRLACHLHLGDDDWEVECPAF